MPPAIISITAVWLVVLGFMATLGLVIVGCSSSRPLFSCSFPAACSGCDGSSKEPAYLPSRCPTQTLIAEPTDAATAAGMRILNVQAMETLKPPITTDQSGCSCRIANLSGGRWRPARFLHKAVILDEQFMASSRVAPDAIVVALGSEGGNPAARLAPPVQDIHKLPERAPGGTLREPSYLVRDTR